MSLPFSIQEIPPRVRLFMRHVGRNTLQDFQLVSFFNEEQNIKDVLRELFHLLGRYDEHVRPDRDQYVQIKWYNIQPGIWTKNYEPVTGVYMYIYIVTTNYFINQPTDLCINIYVVQNWLKQGTIILMANVVHSYGYVSA